MAPKFSLQSVLDVRQRRVEALEVELGRLLQEQQKGEMLLERLREWQQRLFTEIEAQQVGDLDLFAIEQLHRELAGVQERIEQAMAALEIWKQKVAAKRQELVQARQDLEVMESLREKEFLRHREELARIENRLLDDLYISRAYRQERGW
jgi:flagellar export protein FliJ